MDKKYLASSIAGIISVILIILDGWFILEGTVSREITEYNRMQITAVFSIIMVIIFIFGFVMLGIKLKNNYLIISSGFLLITNAFFILNNFLLSSNSLKSGVSNTLINVSFVFGLMAYPFGLLFFGICLYKLKDKLGNTAKIAGLLDISVILLIVFLFVLFMIIPDDISIIYFLVISVVFLVLIAAKLLEAKLLYDVSKS